jgi:hypothetical protein
VKKQNHNMDHSALHQQYHAYQQTTKQEFLEVVGQPVLQCNIDMTSKIFGPIKLTRLPATYCTEDVVSFFVVLDYVSKVEIEVDAQNHVDANSLLKITLNDRSYALPVDVFWRAISQQCRDMVKDEKKFLKIYQKLFSHFGKILYWNTPSA